ncbi:MAG: twin-arginine translocase subunit TatC, partial [Candidatus Binatia bacterium]
MATDSYMTFTEHLEEFRRCLLKSLAAIALSSGVCYFFSESIFRFIVAPLQHSLRPGENLIGTGVTEAFFTEIKVALAAGVFFSCPAIFYQIWRFLS